MSIIKCPVCDGTGLVGRPPWVAGDVQCWTASSPGPWPCKPCGGVGIIDTTLFVFRSNWPGSDGSIFKLIYEESEQKQEQDHAGE